MCAYAHAHRGIYGDSGVFHDSNHYQVFKCNRVTACLIFIHHWDKTSPRPSCKSIWLCNCMTIDLMMLPFHTRPPHHLTLAACPDTFPFIFMHSMSPFHNSVNQLALLIPPTSAAVHQSRELCPPGWVACCGKWTRKPPPCCTCIYLASM